MNCERVFDILTRGPFPTGEACDVHVERHLLACHDCRRLAEALRPAVELLHECVEGQEAESLPGYRGWLDEVPWRDDAPLPVGENFAAPVFPGALPRRQPRVAYVPIGRNGGRRVVRRWWPWLSVAALVAVMGSLVGSQE